MLSAEVGGGAGFLGRRLALRLLQRGTLALTNLAACYAMLACNMNAYELQAPSSAAEPALPL